MGIKIDLVIANPPYGKIGANVTDNIKNIIEYKEYVNLLPANDYKRNTTKDLYKYTKDMIYINKGFADAIVTTHLTKIVKEPNNLTADEFDISNYIDRDLDKYFKENLIRKSKEIDITLGAYDTHEYDVKKSVLFGVRDINHKHLPYGKNTVTYRWNVKEEIDYQWLVDNYWDPSMHFTGGIRYTAIEFKTENEKKNLVNFLYDKDGFRFISKVFTAVNCDGAVSLGRVIPKVDWNNSWSLKDILLSYNYTDSEIENIMLSLNNFKGLGD